MKHLTPILCINGSDSTGASGIQADIKTIKDLGGYAVTAVTSVTVQNAQGIHAVHPLPASMVVGQVRDILEECTPSAVKVGMMTDADSIYKVRDEIVACPNIVLSPGILSSHGQRLMDDDSVRALCKSLMPMCRLLMLKCSEAEDILSITISTDDDMREAARTLLDMGCEYVMLRGGRHVEGRVNALLAGRDEVQFFSSYNVEGWQRHGVGGALSTAIATRLAKGDDVPQAVHNAHDYLHSQVVYAMNTASLRIRPRELYNTYLSLIANNYRKAHDVSYYADIMAITPRYLAQITHAVAGKTPKEMVDDYLIQETKLLLTTTSLTIQEIAQQLGFSSQVVFTRFFKAKLGRTPSEYRVGG